MVCEIMIREKEKKLGRKLTEKEKREIEELMHHTENHPSEEECMPIPS